MSLSGRPTSQFRVAIVKLPRFVDSLDRGLSAKPVDLRIEGSSALFPAECEVLAPFAGHRAGSFLAIPGILILLWNPWSGTLSCLLETPSTTEANEESNEP